MTSPFLAYARHYDSAIQFTVFATSFVCASKRRRIALDVTKAALDIRSVCLTWFWSWKCHLFTSVVAEALGQCKAHVILGRQLGNFARDPNI